MLAFPKYNLESENACKKNAELHHVTTYAHMIHIS